MKLELDPLDLDIIWQLNTSTGVDQLCSTRDITIHRLNLKAQAAVEAVGRGIFYSWDRATYNAVFPDEAAEPQEDFDHLVRRLYGEIKDEFPDMRSWSDLDSVCDANGFFMDDGGEMWPALVDGNGELNHRAFFTVQEVLDNLLREGA